MRGNSSGFIFRYAARLSLLAARLVDDSLGEHCREFVFLRYVPRDAGAGYLIHRADIDNPPPPGYCITASARRFRRVFVFARSSGGGDSRSQNRSNETVNFQEVRPAQRRQSRSDTG